MTKWELARYIIDAKKCVDSILYISDNINSICNLDIRHLVKLRKNEFYLNLSFVLDDCFKNKKALRTENSYAKKVYYNRDKDIAHKDDNFKADTYESLHQIAKELEDILLNIVNLAKQFLPDALTIDIISYDRDLFRFKNNVTIEKEKEVNKRKHPLYNTVKIENGIKLNVVNDLDQLKEAKEIKKECYGVIVEDGLNHLEGLQNRQDWCIKVNVLFSENIWCSSDGAYTNILDQLRKEELIDEFDIPIIENFFKYNKIKNIQG